MSSKRTPRSKRRQELRRQKRRLKLSDLTIHGWIPMVNTTGREIALCRGQDAVILEPCVVVPDGPPRPVAPTATDPLGQRGIQRTKTVTRVNVIKDFQPPTLAWAEAKDWSVFDGAAVDLMRSVMIQRGLLVNGAISGRRRLAYRGKTVVVR